MDSERIEGNEGARDDRLNRELNEYVETAQRQLEYLPAQTLGGIYVQVLALGLTIEDGEAREDAEGAWHRFRRLSALVLEGLERLGGFDGNDLGKVDQTPHLPEFGKVLALVHP